MADKVEFLDNELESCFSAAVEIARKSGQIIRDAFDGDLSFITKAGPADLVTKTDQKVEEIIISFLKKKFPTHCFIGEESVAAGQRQEFTDKPTWMIDPIDGTTNFVHRWPYVSVSIALCLNKQVVVAVVYHVATDEMFTSKKGHGAHMNNKPIHVSNIEDLKLSLIVHEWGSDRRDQSLAAKQSNVMKFLKIPVHGIRSCGSAALNLCMVAMGMAEAYLEYGVHCWDFAAGALICEEAGGVVMDPEGGPLDLMSRRCLVASTRKLATDISQLVDHIEYERD